MRLHTFGVGLFSFHVHNSTPAILDALHRAVGARRLIALLRAGAAATAVGLLVSVAGLMLTLPSLADASIALIAAVVWTIWLERSEQE
jgi:membrane protein implicated in regulation of membrane protease activity